MSEPSIPVTSRYYEVGTAIHVDRAGREVVYLRRRFLPPPEQFVTLHEHTVIEGQRTDQIAAQHLSDPEQFWRLCDANGVLHPEELTDTVGQRVRITLPAGVTGNRHG